ncbi:hypothetical protein B0H13DRAFT_2295295 [Mycena leptocephala]|nr:hypothetical protein B0H13DRAFT_2295295 [Mycena leptocephala]
MHLSSLPSPAFTLFTVYRSPSSSPMSSLAPNCVATFPGIGGGFNGESETGIAEITDIDQGSSILPRLSLLRSSYEIVMHPFIPGSLLPSIGSVYLVVGHRFLRPSFKPKHAGAQIKAAPKAVPPRRDEIQGSLCTGVMMSPSY